MYNVAQIWHAQGRQFYPRDVWVASIVPFSLGILKTVFRVAYFQEFLNRITELGPKPILPHWCSRAEKRHAVTSVSSIDREGSKGFRDSTPKMATDRALCMLSVVILHQWESALWPAAQFWMRSTLYKYETGWENHELDYHSVSECLQRGLYAVYCWLFSPAVFTSSYQIHHSDML